MSEVMQPDAVSKPRGLTPGAVLFAVTLVALGALSAWLLDGERWREYVLRLSWLEIQEVKVASEWPLPPATIQSWLPPLKGHNLLLVSPSELMEKLSTRPWVQSVIIKKEYPDRLVIDVSTKRARAIAVLHGQAHFLDGNGKVIERTSPPMLRALDLPVISWEKQTEGSDWDLATVLRAVESMRARLRVAHADYDVSQIVLGYFPLFKVYLSNPRVEVLFDFETWETQFPYMTRLLHNPPSQLTLQNSQMGKINLVFPKKAVVSSSVSN